ncbi:undecaprenyl-phosphate galactose phosphotransferase WbaP [Rahnella variigena]|uniref:UDP-phosphate galactose phosphotransferase n=1 Tax=Rahnella variigena TaxID=574964 RepID=A0ABX9PXH2_9GAMM|nr:undecaprenyl-phosphate galactose phosphotransferase WbaP [Rahnella variigena]RJT55975.1 undecaprenyl-phosphate galactose phosphotransferase WbaP [Rahnella variigena]RKF68235.1 UDP-phosphate galactose phosphotransferase [Rahnella variigena]
MTFLTRNLWSNLLLALSDFLSFTLSLYLAKGILSQVMTDFEQRIPAAQTSGWIALHSLLAICCVAWFHLRLRHYYYRKTFWFELKEILRTLLIFALIEIAVIAFAKWYFSRYLWVLTWTLVLILVPFARMMTKRVLDSLGLWERDAIIIGSGNNAREGYNAIKSDRNLGLRVLKFISSEPSDQPGDAIEGVPVMPSDENWVRTNVDKKTQFIVAVESHQSDIRNAWLRVFMINGYRSVSVIPTLRGMPLDNTDMSFIFSKEVMIFRVHQNLAKCSSRLAKRLFDIVGSLAIIMLLSPLLLYISRKVRKDGGPAIYGHERIGQNGKPFKCLKFRSMIINSKEVLEELLENNAEARQEWDLTFKLKYDPRITAIGHFLRRTSLDELPQLFNVLKGEMSLVGPRPVITAELDRYCDEVDYYLLSKPGMTGLWQVSGRSEVDYSTRVYLDAWYVKNWSMWNDIAILFKTVSVVLRREGAY